MGWGTSDKAGARARASIQWGKESPYTLPTITVWQSLRLVYLFIFDFYRTHAAATVLFITMPEPLALGGLLTKATVVILNRYPSHWHLVGTPLSPGNLPASQAKDMICAQTNLPTSPAVVFTPLEDRHCGFLL